jgi:hypothetical protein
VAAERQFICEALSCDLIGMSSDLMVLPDTHVRIGYAVSDSGAKAVFGVLVWASLRRSPSYPFVYFIKNFGTQ